MSSKFPSITKHPNRIHNSNPVNNSNGKVLKLVSKVKREEHFKIPILKKYIEKIYENEKEEVNCNKLDLENVFIAVKNKETNRCGSIIIKSKQEDNKDLTKEKECSICLEKMKIFNYKAKSAFNKIARNRNKIIFKKKIFNEKLNSDDKELKQFTCSVNDGFTTECGHHYCFECIVNHVMENNCNCPECDFPILH